MWRRGVAPVRAVTDEVFPLGVLDFVFQIIILSTTYYAYTLARAFVHSAGDAALANGTAVMKAEQTLHIYVEPWLQTKASHVEPLIHGLNWFYVNVHLPAIIGLLIWLYMARRREFQFFRNWFLALNALGIMCYVLIPTAPPRLVPSSGIVDTLFLMSHSNFQGGLLGTFANPYAAMPSLHIAYALFVALSLGLLARHRLVRLMGFLYPIAMLAAITITGNHWLLDGLGGAIVCGAAYVFVSRLSRAPIATTELIPAQLRWRE
jgi:hypothetical protein